MNYDPEQEHRKDVYLCLINMYLSPPDLKDFGIEIPEDTAQPEANVKDALSVLTRHHHLIDTTKVCLFCASPVLPASTKLTEIEAFLGTVMQERTLLKRRTQVMRSLLLAEHLQVCMSCAQLCHIESHYIMLWYLLHLGGSAKDSE